LFSARPGKDCFNNILARETLLAKHTAKVSSVCD
jgi:hypothetical protein